MRKAAISLLLALLLPVWGCDAVGGWADAGNASGDAPAAGDASDSASVYYQYVDYSGSIRFVQSKAEVPAKHRAAAARIELKKQRTGAAASAPATTTGSDVWKKAAEAPWERRREAVVMYTAPWCGVCRRAEAFFRREGVRSRRRTSKPTPLTSASSCRRPGDRRFPAIQT